ncbi:MAG: putative transcriptional regulator, Crp/Fnr family [Bacillota bacterium]|jgi:CRP-like cAMP-binding protein|nr:putative transcriptional regulator, Crp/Fnr family [Bacillota bacterium]
MDEIIKIIKNNILFKDINEDEIKTILACSKAYVQEFEDNEVVFERQDTVKSIGIVIEGTFNLVTQKYNGTRVIVTSLGSNDLFGEALIFSSEKRSPYDLVSSGHSKAIFISYGVFINMCKEVCLFHKTLINNMLTILSDKIIMLNNKMHILNSDSIKEKIAVYLISIHNKTKALTFEMPMKRQELSEFLNVTRPSLSREFSNMQNDNIIEVDRSTVKILDLEKLYELSE